MSDLREVRGRMRQIRTIGVVALLALAATSSYAGTIRWTFDSGLEGWTFTGANAANARWIAADESPLLPDSGYGAPGGGNLYLPDQTQATFDTPDTGSFILQADVFIPNLRPLTFGGWNYPGNQIHQAGIQAYRADNKAVCLEGNYNYGAIRARDYTWDNVWRSFNWLFEDRDHADDRQWYDQWITLKMDYNYSVPGMAMFYAYIPWNSYVHNAGWVQIGPAIETDGAVFTRIAVGGAYSWTQAQFDNVVFTSMVVFEPSSRVAFATALIGLLGARRRFRKKY